MALNLAPEDLRPIAPPAHRRPHATPIFWDGRSDADRLEEAAIGVPPLDEDRRETGLYASPIGIAVAVVAVILALLFFRPGALPRLDRVGGGDTWVSTGDQMADQRLADIRTERQLAELRGDAGERRLVDAHASAFHTLAPPR